MNLGFVLFLSLFSKRTGLLSADFQGIILKVWISNTCISVSLRLHVGKMFVLFGLLVFIVVSSFSVLVDHIPATAETGPAKPNNSATENEDFARFARAFQ